jgi:hypothetical protein
MARGVVACRIVTSVVDTVIGMSCSCSIYLTIPDSANRSHHVCWKRIPVMMYLPCTLVAVIGGLSVLGLVLSTQRLM